MLTDTTYDLYWFAVGSNRAITRVLLPPEYPSIRIMFGFDRPDRRRHRHCPGAGTVRVRGHVPTPSTPLSLRSRLWLTLRKNYDAISVSNHFSFLPIVGSINRLYSLGSNHKGFINIIIIVITDVKGYKTHTDVRGRSRLSCPESGDTVSRHSNGGKRFILTILEVAREEYYVLPLVDGFAQNEIIMINNKIMYLEVILRVIDPRGNPISLLNKGYK